MVDRQDDPPPIPYARQDISEADIAAVVRVLRSDFVTQGPVIEQFEQALAGYCGARHAVAVCNATAALHLACRALGLGPGDTLWTSPNTFVASANCALYCGAGVDFVDVDPRTYNLSAERLEEKLAQAAKHGRLPKVLVAVHFAGQPCDMAAIGALAKRYGVAVIEDAAHAVGAVDGTARVGAGVHSDITVFSFHPVKILTTGEGGMLLTNRPELAERLRLLRSHGVTRDAARMQDPLHDALHGPWYYEQVELGYNYRITEIQAALGLSQLRRLDEFLARRRQLAAQYGRLLEGAPVTLPWQRPAALSAWHLYVVRVPPGGRNERRQVFEGLHAAGIRANVHYIPMHLQPHYRALGFKAGDFPEAERYYAEAISLPMYSALSDAGQARVAAELRSLVS
ncbi:MAG TPA: UDP-4-amino-4,6-dideoxy-N-acetyl-beta-L-altrosamine transaminase [Burkholderiales bacterium]|nr:UDP-4-amino-4,6-dideoxy-N-acetyl-beta-L-altrosamine transaminase [Burkholderiales bacterium]